MSTLLGYLLTSFFQKQGAVKHEPYLKESNCSAQVHVWVGMHTYMCVHVQWRSKDNFICYSSVVAHLAFETDSLTGLEPSIWLQWQAVNKTQRSCSLWLSSSEIINTYRGQL